MEPTEDLTLSLESPSEEVTERVGESLGAHLPPDAVLALSGEMGAGKTTLVRGLGRGLGVAEPVTSPTFTLMHEFEGRLPLYHFDAWMSGREGLFLEGGGAEYLSAGGVAVVEWAERIETYLPRPRLVLTLSHLDPERRGLHFRLLGPPPGASRAAEALSAGLLLALEAAGATPGLIPGRPADGGK